MTISINPKFKKALPILSKEEYKKLESSILEDGVRDPIVLWKDQIIDGHNRYEIATKNEIKYKTIDRNFENEDQVIIWMLENQLGRRNLEPAQRAMVALQHKPVFERMAKDNQKLSEGAGIKGLPNSSNLKSVDTRQELARIAGVSGDTIHKVETVVKSGNKELIEKMRTGEITANKAAGEIKLEQRKIEHAEKIERVKSNPVVIHDKLPNLVLSDPPWRYEDVKDKADAIENKYPTLDIPGIIAQSPKTENDCVLFLWATAPKLEEAIQVMNGWGFKYRSCAVWDKQSIGLGYWFRGQHELLLVGIKGKIQATPDAARVSSVFSEKKTTHSKKPICVYEWIENAFPEHVKLEMYCREARKGWQVFGNEV